MKLNLYYFCWKLQGILSHNHLHPRSYCTDINYDLNYVCATIIALCSLIKTFVMIKLLRIAITSLQSICTFEKFANNLSWNSTKSHISFFSSHWTNHNLNFTEAVFRMLLPHCSYDFNLERIYICRLLITYYPAILPSHKTLAGFLRSSVLWTEMEYKYAISWNKCCFSYVFFVRILGDFRLYSRISRLAILNFETTCRLVRQHPPHHKSNISSYPANNETRFFFPEQASLPDTKRANPKVFTRRRNPS